MNPENRTFGDVRARRGRCRAQAEGRYFVDMPASTEQRPGGRTVRALSLTALAALLCASCATSPGEEPDGDPTAAPPLPGPDDAQASAPDEAPDGQEEPVGDGPLHSDVVVIDPGHNGGNAQDPDSINESVPAGPDGQEKACDTVGTETADGLPEHEFNWELSLLVQERLEADGATVILTREDNEGVGPCINERAEIGNEADADAAVSLHADGGPESGRGFHVIHPGSIDGHTDRIAEPAQVLAEDLHREYERGTGMPVSDYLADEGFDERTDLGGLNLSTVPKVFLETGNMRNEEDAEMLSDAEWRETAADAIARGLATYLLRS
ncbi:N-acetylmuramoyl-L-alanine amidase [Nocardiopsis kunsanensis]|uniref:N-acetylmuramoyl-L-alanine amidase n=2 Tax=Nocardiopsis kunsanensis TaxID=141693 RepID=A0A918XFN4_9ACTN|nr:N-acetylmuramoyl-L-alanine amidase [Nocardiopsis kunsanensis]